MDHAEDIAFPGVHPDIVGFTYCLITNPRTPGLPSSVGGLPLNIADPMSAVTEICNPHSSLEVTSNKQFQLVPSGFDCGAIFFTGALKNG